MPDTPDYQWQRSTLGDGWENMPDPHPRSPLGAMGLLHGQIYDEGFGVRYRRVATDSKASA